MLLAVAMAASIWPTEPVTAQTQEPGPATGAEEVAGEQDRLRGELATRSTDEVTFDVDPVTGVVTFVGTAAGAPLTSPEAATGSPESAADAFVGEFARLFGAGSGAELDRVGTTPLGGGGAAVEYRQMVGGLPVMAGEMRVQVDEDGNILSALGELQPGVTGLDTTPTITAERAVTEAVSAIAKARGVDASALTASAPVLEVYAPDLLGGAAVGPPGLVWRTEVSGPGAGLPLRELVLVDAATAAVALHFDQVPDARDRQVCDQASARQDPPVACASPVRDEVDSDPAGDLDVDNAFVYSGATYDFFKNRFGRDSIDGLGMTLTSIVRHCPRDIPDFPDDDDDCPYDNAFWDYPSSTMYYGEGWPTADDVVGHELTHGIVDYTARLFYWYQSGAINESLADVFGELIDQTTLSLDDTGAHVWLIGESSPRGAARNMRNPAAFLDPDRAGSANYHTDAADNGGVHTNSGVGNKAASLITEGGWFRDIHVIGLGRDKTARLYYDVLATMLGSGSDYDDLARALPQACLNLVGTNGFTDTDCRQVALAVEAVEMDQAPGIFAGDAPGCGPDRSAVPVFTEDVESEAAGRWINPTTNPTYRWRLAGSGRNAPYATSGVLSFWGEPAPVAVQAAIRIVEPIRLPPTPLIMQFNHAFGFEPGYDYGAVEMSIDGGANWFDAQTLFTHGGYNMEISNSGGRRGFSSYSGGYTTSQLDLSSFAGESLMVQFVTTADDSTSSSGWWVDDIRILSCVTARTDAHIRSTASTTWTGNDVYSTNGSGQGRSATVGNRGSASFRVRVENEGNITEPIAIKGPASNSRFRITYDASGTIITNLVTEGVYETAPLAPGARATIWITIEAKSGTPVGASTTAVVKASSTTLPGVRDAVRATVTRTR